MLPSAAHDLSGLANAAKIVDAVLDLIPDSGVMVLDPELRVVLMRGPVYERHGYDVRLAVGRDLHDVIPAVSWGRVGEPGPRRWPESGARSTASRPTATATTGCTSRRCGRRAVWSARS